jgi:hypothetical protein
MSKMSGLDMFRRIADWDALIEVALLSAELKGDSELQ